MASTKNRRPDLEALEVNPGFRYLAPRIFPTLPVVDRKTGTLYYQTMPSDQAAQTGRAAGTAPTRNRHSSNTATFTCAERFRRESTPDDEEILLGGVEAMNRNMAIVGKRGIMRATEDLMLAAILAGTQSADILDSLMQRIDVAIDAIHRYPGRVILATGWTQFRRMTRYSEVTNTLLRTGVIADTAEAIRNVKPMTLADILGVDEVIVGDDDHWSANGWSGKALLYKEVPGAVQGQIADPRSEVQFGRIPQFIPGDADSPFEIKTWYDDDTVEYVLDARVWNVAKLLNAGAGYILEGIDEANTVTTTTTTTTAA